MGHSTFAHIVQIQDDRPDSLADAFDQLRAEPPENDDANFSDWGNYTIQQSAGMTIKPRPAGMTPDKLESLGRAIIRNLQKQQDHYESTEGPERWDPVPWDDEEAHQFLRSQVRKWEPAVVMTIDHTKALVIGVAGG